MKVAAQSGRAPIAFQNGRLDAQVGKRGNDSVDFAPLNIRADIYRQEHPRRSVEIFGNMHKRDYLVSLWTSMQICILAKQHFPSRLRERLSDICCELNPLSFGSSEDSDLTAAF